MVGKRQKSPVTPMMIWLPKEVNEGLLQNLFVGETVIQEMSDLLTQAEEWRQAWDEQALNRTRRPANEKDSDDENENDEDPGALDRAPLE
jgi:hypothetical protein